MSFFEALFIILLPASIGAFLVWLGGWIGGEPAPVWAIMLGAAVGVSWIQYK